MDTPDASSTSVVREYIESVWNQGDTAAFHRMTSSDFQYHLGGQPPRDRSGMEEFVTTTRRAFPDWRVEVSAMVVQGNQVVVRWRGNVSHDGDFHGIPASGKSIKVCGINWYRVSGGRVAEEWEQMDTMGMLRQLGVGT